MVFVIGRRSKVKFVRPRIKINFDELLGYALAIYFLFLPFSQIAIIPGISVIRVISILPFFASITRLRQATHAKLLTEYFFLIIMCVWAVCTSFLSISSQPSGFVSLVSNFGFIIFFSLFHYTQHEYELLCKADIFSAWIASLSIIVGFISGGFLNSGRGGIVFLGQQIDPNFSCGYLVFAIASYTFFFLETKEKKFIFLAFVLICISLITGSRGGLMSTAGTFIIVLFLYVFKKKNMKALFKIIAVLILLCVVFFVFLRFLPESIGARFSMESVINSRGTGRIDIWLELLSDFIHSDWHRILFGNGLGASEYLSSTGHVAHNSWIEYLLSFGVLGFCVYLSFYGYVFFSAYREGQIELASAIAGYYVLQLSLSAYTYRPLFNAVLIWMIYKRNADRQAYCKQDFKSECGMSRQRHGDSSTYPILPSGVQWR